MKCTKEISSQEGNDKKQPWEFISLPSPTKRPMYHKPWQISMHSQQRSQPADLRVTDAKMVSSFLFNDLLFKYLNCCKYF